MKGIKTCKICGKQYEYCRSKPAPGPFRWQDVACCIEHASLYLAQVEAARNPDASASKQPKEETQEE